MYFYLNIKDDRIRNSKYKKFILGTIDLVGGGLGGIANVFVGQPFDTVKVKMQTFPSLYKKSTACLIKTFKSEGLKGVYAGMTPALVANIAENSVVFAAYGAIQQIIKSLVDKPSIKDLNTLENATCGFFAAFFSALVICPTELVKCRLQAMEEVTALKGGKREYIGAGKLTMNIIKEEGPRGIYRGLGCTLIREMPGYFFYFGAYEGTRILLTPEGKTKDEIGLLRTGISGGIGGITLWTVIYPFDLAKSKIQVEGLDQGTFTVIRSTVMHYGIRGLYAGLWPTLLRTFPSTAALICTLEYSKKLMYYITGISVD